MLRRLLLALSLLLAGAVAAHAASSQQNRDDSLLYVGITPLGIHVPTLLTMPVGLGVYVGEDWQFIAEHGSISAEEDDDETEAEATFTNTGGMVRWFPGTNSFNVFAGAHRRVWEGDASTTINDTINGREVEIRAAASLNADATVGSLGIGNQWMMDYGLVLGLDWLVASGLMSSSTDVEVSAEGTDKATGLTVTLTDAQREEAREELQDLGDTLNTISGFPGVFVFSIGWAF